MRADPRREAAFGVAPPVAPRASNGHASPALPPRAPIAARAPADDEIVIGASEMVGVGPVGLSLPKLIAGRLMIQGVSGAGKSWTLRRLLEQTAGKLQQIVLDPERAFKGLAERYGHLWVDASKLDEAALAALAARVREHRISIVLDLFDLARAGQMIAAAAFLEPLVNIGREHWHAALVAIDEAQRFAPLGLQSDEPAFVRKRSIAAVVDVMSLGRKRGLCGILATLRLARLSKSATSEILNYLIGQNTLDRDIARAAETIGWASRRAQDRLPMLQPGDFVAVGPAFSVTASVIRVGKVETFHADATPAIVAPPARSAEEAARLVALGDLERQTEQDAAQREETRAAPGMSAVRAFIRDPGFAGAARVWEALLPLAPDGARLSEIATRFRFAKPDPRSGLELLDRYGVLEFAGEGDERAVRIARGMLPKAVKP